MSKYIKNALYWQGRIEQALLEFDRLYNKFI